MEYVTFTEEEKDRAGAVSLEEFLKRQGEELEPSGSEWRWKRHDSVTVRGNTWYRHSCKYGGSTVQFLQEFYDMTYVEAMKCLLEGNYQPVIRETSTITPSKLKKEFQLPEMNPNVKRALAYLSRTRLIDYEILKYFVDTGAIYEEKKRHNVVFVGFNHQGIARHAHMKGTYTNGESFRLNVEGSDPACGFGYCGNGSKLYVFEAAIDLLSFLTLYPFEWQQQSYICLDGLSEHAMLQVLHSYPWIQEVILCMDYDPAGIEGCYRMQEILKTEGYDQVSRLASRNKDWNEDLKEIHGIKPVPAREHPRLMHCMKLCVWLKSHADRSGTNEEALKQICDSYHHYERVMRWQEIHKEERTDELLMCLEDMSIAGFQLLLEFYRSEDPSFTREQLANDLFKSYQPHRDRGKMRGKSEKLNMSVEAIMAHAGIQSSSPEELEIIKGTCKQFILACLKLHIHITVTAEEQRLEVNRGMSEAYIGAIGAKGQEV